MTIGLIGYGRFGRLLAKHLAKHAQVMVHDQHHGRIRFPSASIQRVSLEVAASQPIVILAVPISALRTTLVSVRKHLPPSAIVFDVCSVKRLPVRWMQELLPQYIHIVGTHPLFGPDSASRSLAGHNIVLCPVRISKRTLSRITALLKKEKLRPRTMTPADHDRLMAQSLFLTQFIGRAVSKARLQRHEFSTAAYAQLMKIVEIADNDSRELFRDMYRYNPYTKSVLKKMGAGMSKVVDDLRLNDHVDD